MRVESQKPKKPRNKVVRPRCFTFTIFNYTEQDIADIPNWPDPYYLIAGYEICPTTGRPHIQGFVHWKKQWTFAGLKKLHPTAHWEGAVKPDLNNQIYCSKDTNLLCEIGKKPTPGQRMDLIAFKDAIVSGATDVELETLHTECYLKYNRMVSVIRRNHPKKLECPAITLKKWQEDLIQVLKGDPHDRQIHFIVDRKGRAGKTTFSKYIHSLFPHVQLMDPAKHADMAYELREDTRILIMDCPRSRTETLQYHFLEKLKDGMVHSGKYESCTKILSPCHVVVFMNELPDMTKLSEDRYVIIEL